MNAKDLKLGAFYDIKSEPDGPWEFIGAKKGNNPSHWAYQYGTNWLSFRNVVTNKTIKKDTAHGIKEALPPVLPVPIVQKQAKNLPRVASYDKLASQAELVATFLRTIDIEGGVIDVEHKGFITPTVFVFPAYVKHLQTLIQKVNLTNLETSK